MNDTIRIRLSAGLIVVAVIHAVLLGLTFAALHERPTATQLNESWKLPTYRPNSPGVGQIEKLQQPQSVNLQAQGEIKQQIRVCPTNCPPTYQPYYPPSQIVPAPVVYPTIVQPTIVTPTNNAPSFTTSPVAIPAPSLVAPTTASTSPPPKKAYQIALFVGGDSTSQTLQEWFARDKQLATLRESCEFQVYTSANPIYRTRYADIVPAEQFPVVLFQDATGGHIHAAGRTMIPRTPAELYSDLKHGYTLYKQAKEAQKTGALKTRGYSWDDSITPQLYLSAQDCPDGYCPSPQPETRRPLDRVRDLFDGATDTRNALLWLSAGEIATVALIGIAAVLLVFILIKRAV